MFIVQVPEEQSDDGGQVFVDGGEVTDAEVVRRQDEV